jgi:hypothetical protein
MIARIQWMNWDSRGSPATQASVAHKAAATAVAAPEAGVLPVGVPAGLWSGHGGGSMRNVSAVGIRLP